MWSLRREWKTPYYRATIVYIAFLVTLIFGFQMYRYFIAVPLTCPPNKPRAVALIPLVGVLFDG